MPATDDRHHDASDVLRPLPRATGGGSPRSSARPSTARPGSTGAQAALRARQVGRSQSVRDSVADGAREWLSRPRWTDVDPEPPRKRFEPPITGDARYDSLIRMIRRRREPSPSATRTPGPGLPRASARRGTAAGGGTGPGEGGRRLNPYPVQPTPTPALKGVVACDTSPGSVPRRAVLVAAAATARTSLTTTSVAAVDAGPVLVRASRCTPPLVERPRPAPSQLTGRAARPPCDASRRRQAVTASSIGCAGGVRRRRCEGGRHRREQLR